MDTRVEDSPPTYAEENSIPESHSSRVLDDDTAHLPPPYEPRAEPTREADSPSDHKGIKSADSKSAPISLARPPSENPTESPSSSTAAAAASQSKSRSAFSFIRNIPQAYEERKKAKEAARKVDFYEKNYGFVPKNVMSTAEWEKARKDAPKVKVPNKVKATPYFGHHW